LVSGNVTFPILGDDILIELFKTKPYSVKNVKNEKYIQNTLLKVLDNNILSLPRRGHPKPDVGKKTLSKMVAAYESSYYAKKIHTSPIMYKQVLDGSVWWWHLSMASFVEDHIEKGYTIG
jgi:hypothetical protein